MCPNPPTPPHDTSLTLTDILNWIPTILQGCADEVAHALRLKMFRQYGAHANSLPRLPIRNQWD